MPLFEYKCDNCKDLYEEYFHTFANSPITLPCKKCGAERRRIMGRVVVGRKEVPGYEKENQGKLTMGKAIDMKQAWV